ncbi:PREDICTED: spermatogenesis-associated protein 17 [Gavialis gangeticus]|uniref:spermatogenesis-associated protein 17 n=1 Tax=Gavialis gangeticus TaxID=94835 RepID=UPI00092FC82C|nr:PREDICTED: spermatogenesis-associated protein 17 [Gavialis gangeticus]
MVTACTRAGGGGAGSMAAWARLRTGLPELLQECFHSNRFVGQYRKTEHAAAVKIQSWFRGCRVRAYIRYLNKMMIVIQKWWRGYQGRKHFRKMLKTAYFIMKMNFYNEMAVRIQKRWRGYYIRKYIHNYYTLKKYLEAVSLNNEIVRKELEEFAEMKEKEKEKKDLERKEKKKDHQARKMHYLLSTEQIPGVFNSPFRASPDPMELRLQKAKPLSHRHQQIKENLTQETSDFPTYTSSWTFPMVQPLPPIARQKPQGPFRDTAEVLLQRYKPLEPTLRAATSINSLEKAREEMKREEWRNRIHDNEFLPFSSCQKNQKYDPLIHSSSKYGQITYGTKHFREEHHEKWVANKDFETVLPPIDLFDRCGKTYSRAGQIV